MAGRLMTAGGQALTVMRTRLASAASPPAALTSAASVQEIGRLPGLGHASGDEALATLASPEPQGAADSAAAGTGPADAGQAGTGQRPHAAAAGQERRFGPSILADADSHVPAPLRVAAAWSWRLILVAAIVYLSFKVVVALRLLVLPFIAAILLCALLQPFAARLHRASLPKPLATGVTLASALVVLAGVGWLITNQVQAGYQRLSAEVLKTIRSLQHDLSGPPFHLNGAKISQYASKFVSYLENHKTVVLGTALTGGKYFLEVLAGIVLTVFITFFLLKDGDEIWANLVKGFERFRYGKDKQAASEAAERSKTASTAAWQALVSYIHGTTIIAIIHAVLIGLALWLLGVPLIMPIALLVFIAAYIPLIGILIVGALAVLVTLATQGWVAAVILIVVLLVENQIESHLLQPLIIGRAVQLRPLEVIVVLAVGGIVAGIPGAIVAVPTAAVISAAWRSTHPPDQPASGSQRERGKRERHRAAEEDQDSDLPAGSGLAAEPEPARPGRAGAGTSRAAPWRRRGPGRNGAAR